MGTDSNINQYEFLSLLITAGWSLTLCVCSFQGSVGAHTGNLINALAAIGVGHVEK